MVWPDSGYWGASLARRVEKQHGWKVEIVSRNALVNRRRGQPALVTLPRRRVVEGTFAGFGNWRRLSWEEKLIPRSSETWIYVAMTALR